MARKRSDASMMTHRFAHSADVYQACVCRHRLVPKDCPHRPGDCPCRCYCFVARMYHAGEEMFERLAADAAENGETPPRQVDVDFGIHLGLEIAAAHPDLLSLMVEKNRKAWSSRPTPAEAVVAAKWPRDDHAAGRHNGR